VAFELPEIVAQLVQAVGTGGEVEAGENGVEICLAVQPPT